MLLRALRRPNRPISRRRFLRRSGAFALGVFGTPLVAAPSRAAGADSFGPLLAPDANGLRLPAGFTSRIVATSGEPVAATGHVWHESPDGGATFPTGDGGWVYVSNAELGSGGVAAIRFAPDGTIISANTLLSGTSRNCAGGPTPWGSWLSCEEVSDGQVYECDPLIPGRSWVLPGLGTFRHEAAAVDPVYREAYLTEDRSDGLLYRFTPANYPNLMTGILEAAEVLDPQGEGSIQPGQVRPLAWHEIPDPDASQGTPTRDQAPDATSFDGGEGCWYQGGRVYFSTKGTNQVWSIDTAAQTIEILYDPATQPNPELSGVDNVFVSTHGDVYVAEDPGDLQIVALTPTGGVVPVVQITGVSGTEVTGPALSPDGTRLYFSSQRSPGETFEVTGPFVPAPAVVPVMRGAWRGLMTGALVTAAALALRKREVEGQALLRPGS